MTLRIQTVGKYTHPQKGTQNSDFFGIGLNVSGLIYSESYYPDGRMKSLFDQGGREAAPSMNLSVKGKLRFEYNSNRENWIIFLKEPCPFYYDPEKQQIMYQDDTHSFAIARSIALKREEIPGIRRTFQEIRDCMTSAIPQNIVRAEVLAMELLLRFFQASPEANTSEKSAADLLRDKIDSDLCWVKSLDEMAREIGFGRDHLRHLFKRKYGISPGEYRVRQRLAAILQLLSDTSLSMKEIAARVGIPHVTYLNILIRKYYHTTPGELRRKYRSSAG